MEPAPLPRVRPPSASPQRRLDTVRALSQAGVTTGVIMAICFGVGVSLYSFVYGPNSPTFIGIDLAHFVVAYGVAGAILGAWK